MPYSILRRAFPEVEAASKPKRIVFLRPCCIGDVVMATAALSALRETFPEAHIAWAVGPWSARAIEHHRAIDAILDTGSDTPLHSAASFLRLVRRLRAGDFDLAVSLLRSPLMCLAVYLAGIPLRAGLDSNGRGFAYNLRVPIDPAVREHESEIYLKVVSEIAGREVQASANLPVTEKARAAVRARLAAEDIGAPFIVAHPGGGGNPGAQLASKRYPPPRFAEILNRVAADRSASVILVGGPADADLAAEVADHLAVRAASWLGQLNFQEIGALAAEALFLYRQRHRLDPPGRCQRRPRGDADGTDRPSPIRALQSRSSGALEAGRSSPRWRGQCRSRGLGLDAGWHQRRKSGRADSGLPGALTCPRRLDAWH